MQELSAWPAWANLVETLRRLAWKYKGRGSKGKNNGHWVGGGGEGGSCLALKLTNNIVTNLFWKNVKNIFDRETCSV